MSIGKIEIDILANTTKLIRGMKKAEKSFDKSIKNMMKGATGLIGVFASGAILNKINATSDALDKIGKTSSKIGITAEALQGLHLGATEAGMSTNTLDMALQRMTRRVAEAAKGTGEAKNALKELGLDAKELANMTPDDMLKRVADSMVNVTSQSDRVRLSMKLFDTEGVAMVNMLKDGSKGLEDVAKKANKFGLIIDTKYIKAIEKSNDAWGINQKVMDTAWAGMTVGLNEALYPLLDAFYDSDSDLDVFGKSLQGTKEVIYHVARGFEILSSSLTTAVGGYELLASSANVAMQILFNGSQADINSAMDAYNASIVKSTQNNKDWIASLAGTSEASTNLKEALNSVPEELKTITVSAEYDFSTLDMSGMMPDRTAGAEAWLSSLEKEKTLWGEIKIASDNSYTSITDKTRQANAVVGILNNTISSGITNAFRKAMDGATDFSGMMENILKDVVAQLINVLVVQTAVNAALKGMGFTNGASGAVSGGAVSVGGAMADGGIVKSGSSFLVGERGPEIVSLPRGANVIPNGGDSGGGGVNVSVNVINNTSSDVSVNQKDNEIEIIIDTISNQVTRGVGSFPTALEGRYGLGKS